MLRWWLLGVLYAEEGKPLLHMARVSASTGGGVGASFSCVRPLQPEHLSQPLHISHSWLQTTTLSSSSSTSKLWSTGPPACLCFQIMFMSYSNKSTRVEFPTTLHRPCRAQLCKGNK